MAKRPSLRRNFVKPDRKPKPARLWGKDTVRIERMSQEGRGVASRAGKVVFVRDALAGEEVRIQCTAVKRDYDEADMLELLPGTAPSAARVEPECPLYRRCGGCSLQHWSAESQQQHKQANLLAMLRSVSPDLALDPPIRSRASGFRHRLRLLVTRAADGSYALGMRQRGSHEPVQLAHCTVAGAAVNTMLQRLPLDLPAIPGLQGLREIEIDADSNDRIGLCFYLGAHPGDRVLSALRATVLTGPVIALRVRVNTPGKARRNTSDDSPRDDDPAAWQEIHSEGELCLRLDLPREHRAQGGHALQLGYQPGDFTQTQWEVNAALIARALDWLQPGSEECGLDLFSGIGNFSLPLAGCVKQVHALEGVDSMTVRLIANARRNGIDNIRALTRDLMAADVTLPRAEIAIVDPPRAGAKAACEALARSRVQRLLYVSCHPATLLRDARTLHDGGFTLARAAAVDMFPHTGHSEAVALFRRGSSR